MEFGKNVDIAPNQAKTQLTFTEGTRNTWDVDFSIEGDFDIDAENTFSNKDVFDTDISSLNRLDLGFDEQAFTYQVRVTKLDDEMESMATVMNDNIERWLGFGSLDTAEVANETGNELMAEESRDEAADYEEPMDSSEAYDNMEDVKYLMVLWRFDIGGGAKILDLSENKNNGNILVDKAVISNEEAAKIWENGQLEAGQPIAFEDEWGKESPPNWALTFTGNELLRIRGSKSLAKLKGHFTFQAWLKVDEFDSFTLFKRQAEDFNIKLKDPNLIEVSREHNIRNILTFELSEPIPKDEWAHITIIYRQIQPNEDQHNDLGIKILLNAKVVYEDPELNFKKPLVETDGLILCEGLKGQLTEIRFWNINLSQQIVQETYKRPLDCVNELRKRIHIGDDQFAGINLGKKKSRGKRATLVAPSGKTFGFKGGLRLPPRSSVKMSQNEMTNLREEVDQDKIKEESDEDNDKSSNNSDIDDETPKDDTEEPKIENQSDGQESPSRKDETPKGDDKSPISQKHAKKDSDEFAFDFDSKPKKDEQNSKQVDTFWNDDGFELKPKVKESKAEGFDDFDFDSKPKVTKKQTDDDFEWNDDQPSKPKDAASPKNQDDEWGFDQPSNVKADPHDDFGFEEENKSEDKESNNEEVPKIDEKISEDEEDQTEHQEKVQIEVENDPEGDDKCKSDNKSKADHSSTEEQVDPDEKQEVEENPDKEKNDTSNDNPDENSDPEEPQNESIEEEQKEGEGIEDDFEFSKHPKEEEKQDEVEVNDPPQEQPEKDDSFEFESKPEKQNTDEFTSNQDVKKDDDFGFDEAPKKKKVSDDDFNFDVPAAKPKTTDDDFGFDFDHPKPKQSQQQDDDFDFDFGGSKNKQVKIAAQDDFGFDDFDTKPKAKDEKPKEESQQDKVDEEQVSSPEANLEEEKETPELVKKASKNSGKGSYGRKGSALRK